MSSKKQTGWCLIPPSVFYRTDISPTEKLLIGKIIGLLNKNGYCFASNKWLGDQLGISKGRVANIIMELHQRGLLKIELIREHNRIIERRIYPVIDDTPIHENVDTPIHENVNTPIHENVNTPIHENVNTYSRKREYPIHENVKGSNNNNRYNNNRYNNSLSQVLETFDEALRLSRLLYTEILLNETSTRLPNITNPKEIEDIIHTWAKDIEKLIRIDRQDPSIVEEVVRWVQQDGFWGPNVLSGRKLREKWDVLVARKKQHISISQRAASMQKNKKEEDDDRFSFLKRDKAIGSSI